MEFTADEQAKFNNVIYLATQMMAANKTAKAAPESLRVFMNEQTRNIQDRMAELTGSFNDEQTRRMNLYILHHG